MRAQSPMKSWRQEAVNSFLLCTVLAKQTRRLRRLMPDRRIPDLIMIALKNSTDYELVLDVGARVPEIVRDEAMLIGRLTSSQAKRCFLARLRVALSFLWAALSILLILAAIYLTLKGEP